MAPRPSPGRIGAVVRVMPGGQEDPAGILRRQPRYPRKSPRTGGFASPPCSGYAFVSVRPNGRGRHPRRVTPTTRSKSCSASLPGAPRSCALSPRILKRQRESAIAKLSPFGDSHGVPPPSGRRLDCRRCRCRAMPLTEGAGLAGAKHSQPARRDSLRTGGRRSRARSQAIE